MIVSESMKYKLWAGYPIEIPQVGNIVPLTLKEIVELGYEAYQKSLGILLVDSTKIESITEDVSTIEILRDMCEANIDLRNYILAALELMCKKQFQFLNINGAIFSEIGNPRNALTLENYEEFKHVLKAQYCIFEEEVEEYNPANAAAREMIEKIKKNKANAPKQKPTISLLSMISAITWKGAQGNIHNILGLTIYQIHDAYYRLMTIDNFENTMLGIYTGNVDAKKVKMKDVDWAKVIDVVK